VAGRAGPPSISELVEGFQRWLLKSSARSVRREVGDQVRRSLGGRRDPGDVWAAATSKPPDAMEEAPECAWCPVCRAARRIRQTRPGLGGPVASASEAVAAAVNEAFTAFESIFAVRQPSPRPGAVPSPPEPPEKPSGQEERAHGPDDRG
jgi:hypothetical protein